MGSLFSCCRRRSTDDDREPLLSRPSATHEEPHALESHIEKIADIFAAVRVGKLPSQDQTNVVLRKLLRSDVLAIPNSKSARVLGQKEQYGPLSDRGKKIVKDIRELVEAVIQFGLEKNDDDIVQDLIYQNIQLGKKPVSVDLKAAKDSEAAEELNILANAIPSFKELDNDMRRLSDALFALSRMLLTSSNFRLLLSDVLLTSRALLADAAADVGQVAHIVERKADAVERALTHGDKETESPGDQITEAAKQAKDGIKDIHEETKGRWENLGEEASHHFRESAVDRLQKILAQAQQDPTYRSALHTLIFLLSKYVERVSTAATAVSYIATSTTTVPTPVIATDPHLKRALTDLRILLERLASGRSLSLLIVHLERALKDFATASPELQSTLRRFFEDLRSGIEKALGEPGFATSREGHDLAQQLFERGQALFRSNSLWSVEANKVLDEVDAFVYALESDRTTRRIIDALDNLSKDTADLFQSAVGAVVKRQQEVREELKVDLIGWVLPRVLTMLKTLPMPRVELKSKTLELVVDALVLSATTSFVPDHIFVQSYNEVRVEASTAASENPYANGAGVQSSTRIRTHIDGLRVSAHCIGYYVQYKGLLGGLLSWQDNGLVSVDVGKEGAPGEGLSVDIDLETTPVDEDTNQGSVFRVNDVNVDVSGLHVLISKSRHWILNTLFLQPIASPIVRRMLQRILASQIQAGLENVNERLSAVRLEANRRVESKSMTDGGTSIEDYWDALCATISSSPADENSEDQELSLVETDTQVTTRGVVRNTRTKMMPEPSSPSSPSETLVAVGIGPQILPGKGGPELGADSATDQAREALREVESATEHAAGKARDVTSNAIETAAMARETFQDASARMEEREGVEKRKKGWRSRVFDF